jgi:hypothetical protein
MKLRLVSAGFCLLAFFAMSGILSAQGPGRYTFFGGAVLGSPSGFVGGAGVSFGLTHNLTFDPSVAIGRSGHSGLFTLDGSFHYEFHPDDAAFVPYVLAGVGLAQWGSDTSGSALIGVGARIPLHHDMWIVPEVRAGAHGLGRFTIGISKSF